MNKVLEPVESKRYRVKIVEYVIKQSKISGYYYVRFTFEVLNDPIFAGRRLYKTFSLKENALWTLREFMNTIASYTLTLVDHITDDGEMIKVLVGDISKLVGIECYADVSIKQYRDTYYNELTNFSYGNAYQ